MQWASHRLQRIVGCLAVTAVVIGLAVVVRVKDPPPVVAIREMAFDSLQRLSPRPYQDVGVRVVDIDEASLKRFGQWPWPRTVLADLVTRLTDLGAAAIAFDILFPEPDRTSPKQVLTHLADANARVRGEVEQLLEEAPDHDAVFAAAIRTAPVVLGFATGPEPNASRPGQGSGYATAGTSPARYLAPFRGGIVNLPEFEVGARGHGTLDRGPETSAGITRSVPLIISDGQQLYAGLALEALRVAQAATTTIVRSADASGATRGASGAMLDVRVGAARVPTTRDGAMVLYYDHNRPERYVSAAAVLDAGSEALRALIAGHIVFVGSSAAGLLDTRVTALGETVPGVMVHAQVVEQMIAGRFLARPDWATGFEITSIVFWSAAVAILLLAGGARFAAAVIIAVIASVVWGAWLVFARYGLLLDPTYTAASAILAYFATSGVLYITSDREKRFIRRAFGQFLAPQVLARLERRPDLLKLGGEIRHATIMFMDVRDFTAVSEQLSAEQLTTLLNTLLSPLSDVIQDENGTIDKYIGDSIMAFWNAPVDVPDHAARACRAALRMLAECERLNRCGAFPAGPDGRPLQIQIGIGLNTGDACVGNMGSERHFNYSMVGDAVNAAARIESSCKGVGYAILISEETNRAIPSFATLEVGTVSLKGRAQSATLYALIGDEAVASTETFRQLRQDHAAVLAALAAQDQAQALAAILECRLLGGPPLAGLYDGFVETVRRRNRLGGGMKPDLDAQAL